MNSVKTQALKLIETLPDTCSWADILYRVNLNAEIALSREDVKAGRVFTHEEVVKEMEAWLASSGPVEPSSTSGVKSLTSETIPAPLG